MEVKRPNSQANDIAMQKLQEKLLKAQEEGVEGIATTVEVTRPDGSEIPDDEIQIEITGGTSIDSAEDTPTGTTIEDSQETEAAPTATAEAETSEEAVQENIPSIEQIISSWHNQANAERQKQGIGAEFSNLLNPYQLQGQSPVLSFEDLVKIGEYYSTQTTPTVTATAPTPTTQSVEETKPAATQTTEKTDASKATQLIEGEDNIGSPEYAAKILKLALPESNLAECLVYYDMLYDDRGRVTQLTKNSAFENINVPDFIIGYPDTSNMESVSNCINLIWSDGSTNSGGVEVIKNADGTTTAMTMAADGSLAESKIYDANGNCKGISKNIAAGETFTYKGIKITNPTNKMISISYAFNSGMMAVQAPNAVISYVSGDDAISQDKVVISDGDKVQSYEEYQKSQSSSSDTADTSSKELNSTLTKLITSISEIINSLKK